MTFLGVLLSSFQRAAANCLACLPSRFPVEGSDILLIAAALSTAFFSPNAAFGSGGRPYGEP